ncbi:dTDP-4-dehydrorhamnose reductase [Aquibium sp. ELW1220]|uniref:dTDP-4-dehydrorhamnose reductase n=1 Tax=Aquibium sp. ELW1220 TaxID=2976766 RepID=UPI0025B23E84|nr:dTDP-4-dehydrorhamnose reductase [Aquibium sp. ELW1220]MDN2582338.1 dTDP-4-dehydrorhamnose reductase [Aquibium sp. ELW1220]
MKLLVFGKTGQVARELARRCPPGMQAIFLGREQADLSVPERCAAAIRSSDVDVVINAAAWTAVDHAEDDETLATLVNGAAPGAMAQACAERGIPLLHLSTDYVFDGSGTRPFEPADAPAPLNAYGRSKLAGEAAIRASGARHLVLRTSWVVSAHGTNFVRTMLRLGRERDVVRVVSDQIGGPTPAGAIAEALLSAARDMAAGAAGGTHHFAGAPDTSWAEFARAIMTEAGLSCAVEDIPSAAYPTRARRPLNSRLDCTGFERAFGIARPDWREGLAEIVAEIGGAG